MAITEVNRNVHVALSGLSIHDGMGEVGTETDRQRNNN